MTLEKEIIIEWYEAQMDEEDIEEARRKHILSLDVDEAKENPRNYVEYLIEGYRGKLEEGYYKNVRRSEK